MTVGGLAPEAVIGDRYRLCRSLGEGGMGVVWEAVHVFTHQRFALKFLKGAKEEDRRRFQREVRAAAAVRHPNLVGVHDFVELPNGTLVMVMDLLEGETLGAVVARQRCIPLDALAAVLLPVLSALEAAHAIGIVHRDLKPDNIFLAKTGAASTGVEIKVLDFGVAKLTAVDGLAARTQALTGTGSMVGTPYYMSPEQVFSEKDLDARADIWSLGVVMYECLAGVRPTEGENIGRVLKRILVADFEPIAGHCKDLPEDVASLVGRMLSTDREKRPQDMTDVRQILERHAAAAIPSFSSADSVEAVDPHAPTIASDDAVRPSMSTPPAARDAEAGARADTNRAVSLAPARPARPRTGGLAAFAVLAVAVIGGAVVASGFLSSEPKAPATPASIAPSTTSELPTATSSVATAATASAPVATDAPAVPSSAIAATQVTPRLRRPPAPTLPPSLSSGASPITTVAPAVSAATSAQPARRKPPPGLAENPKD